MKLITQPLPPIDGYIIDAALDILREGLDLRTCRRLRNEMETKGVNWITPYHFGYGMVVRNAFRRSGLPDSLLPEKTTWDDYYVALLECVVKEKTETDDE